MRKLVSVKITHTVTWIFFNVVIFYLCYAVIAGEMDKLAWLCIGLILLEGVVLLCFKGVCPLTLIARRYSNSTKDNFDIYLPLWLARYNKVIYTSVFVVIMIILLYRLAKDSNA